MARILVMEGAHGEDQGMTARLKTLGHTVTVTAFPGEEVSQTVKQEQVDLVLINTMSGNDTDCVQAAEFISTRWSVPVVYIAADADEKNPCGYLLTPIEDQELHTTIEMALHKGDLEKKVRESHQQLYTILKSIGDGVITTDTEGVVTFMNPAAETLTGWSEKDAVGTHLHDVFSIHTESDESLVERIKKRGDTLRIQDTVLRTREEAGVFISASVAPIGENHGMTGVAVVFQDNRAQKKAEKELKGSRLQLRSLLEASKLINSTMDMKKLFTFVADSVQFLVGFEHIIIYLVSKEELTIQMVYASEEIEKNIQSLTFRLGEGPVGKCVEKGEIQILHAPIQNEVVNGMNIRSHIIVPLKVETTSVGALHVAQNQQRYSQQDADALGLLSEMVSSALKNSQLYSNLKEISEQLEQRIEERTRRTEMICTTRKSLQEEFKWKEGLNTLAESVRKLGFDRVGVFLANPMKKTLDFRAGRGIKGSSHISISLTQHEYPGVQCVLEKKTVQTRDTDSTQQDQIIKSQSCVWVPIIVQDEVIAALAAASTNNAPITAEDVIDLEILASMSAAFIDRTRILVEPIAEDQLRTSATHWLEPMDVYIINERKPKKSIKIFVDLVTHGVPGFVISRMHPERMKRKHDLMKTPLLWLSRMKTKNTINPDDLPKLNFIIEDFAKKSKESVVLLDGMEYLITQNGFAAVLTHMQELKDIVVLNNSRLVIPLHAETLPVREFSMLEREFQVLD